jgi:protein-S-isoprenylcysteine O-methyltransferase Ste14
MGSEALYVNRAIVLGFGILYWAGVYVQARRIRKRIRRSPNVKPRGFKEKLLWLGWLIVVVSWLSLPFVPRGGSSLGEWGILSPWLVPLSVGVGAAMMVGGYAGTLWCYVAMGDAWRMGVLRTESIRLITYGPYGFVRHPIYLFQMIMVAAICVLLPSPISLAVLTVHVICVLIKAADEEAHLRSRLGSSYAAYCACTGTWLPLVFRNKGHTGHSSKPADEQIQ